MKYFASLESPIGELFITYSEKGLSEISWKNPIEGSGEKSIYDREKGEYIIKELQQYFEGKRQHFDIPLDLSGTEFQQRVWQALLQIPYGHTKSYKDISEMVNCHKGYRAIGMANHNNPIPIIIPCHRVINSSGKLGGYGGGLDNKVFLLDLEKRNI
jgi:methylated-DNA-[protein]-cysteine S-methyltransferase